MLSIRPATIQDVEILASLGRQTFHEAYADQNSEEDMQSYISKNFSGEQISQKINEPGAFFFIAEYNGVPVGYTRYGSSSISALDGQNAIGLERIYILNEFQGKGIGRRLVDHAIDFARAAGKEMIWLGVWEKNYNALGFYTRMGFRKVGEKTFTIGSDVQNDYVMALKVQEGNALH
ncbi:MAG: paiA [Sphingobacteriaceae bacterium]|jgi:ribosomal protein S18 acetylase RimI-like enzyme|nr:paiA [Sphingobacteriaceae bacterium]